MQLRVRSLSKRYGSDDVALDDLDAEFSTGVTAILGPNGSGKTTLLRMLTTELAPTSGTIEFDGVDVTEDPQALRARLGYLPQHFGVYPKLTCREYLEYLAALRGLRFRDVEERIEDLVETVGLEHATGQPLGEYSGGMKRRVGIAQALLNDPDLLILDEPEAGLDPGKRAWFERLLTSVAEDRIVLLSTHFVDGIETVASSLLLLDDAGGSVYQGSTASLLDRVRESVWMVDRPADGADSLPEDTVVLGNGDSGGSTRVVSTSRPTTDAVRVGATVWDAYRMLLVDRA